LDLLLYGIKSVSHTFQRVVGKFGESERERERKRERRERKKKESKEERTSPSHIRVE